MVLKSCTLSATRAFIYLCVLLSLLGVASCRENKYSKEANNVGVKPESHTDGENPFRMGKINQIWTKAQKVLSTGKLASLRADLTTQDKQEMTWKRLRLEGGDKDGLKEAQLRTQLLVILDRYGLARYHPDSSASKASDVTKPAADDDSPNSRIIRMFKDKRLNKLWEKAEKAGFSQEELKTLREEFQHHQDRVQEYHELLEEQEQSRELAEELSNEILGEKEQIGVDLKRSKSQQDYKSRVNELHSELTDNYNRLHVAAVAGPNSRAFTEPKVDGLWVLAQKADFNAEELDSLHAELKHYETRLQKLRYHQSELHKADERHGPKKPNFKTEGRRVFDQKINDKKREVEKLQVLLEDKILSRHSEL